MTKQYLLCGCGWYGPENALSEKVSYQRLEFWGQPVVKEDRDPACPECGDDCFSDANAPCELCEELPCATGSDVCAKCLAQAAN